MRNVFLVIIMSLASFINAATVVEEIVARIGNEIITRSDLNREEQRLYDELSRRYQGQELEDQYRKAEEIAS